MGSHLMNTRKHTLLIRAASLALFALDCWLPCQAPSCAPFAMLVCWLLGSMALALAIAPNKSRFSL